jgi:hypothetical protein
MDGGKFVIISNNGGLDILLNRMDMLMHRLQEITKRKLQKNGKTDPRKYMPLMADITKTHICHFDSVFKPHVQCVHTYMKTGAQNPKLEAHPTVVDFTLPAFGHFVNDPVLYVKMEGPQVLDPVDKVKFVDLLGHRMIKKVSVIFAGNTLDEYGPEEMNLHLQCKVPPEKKEGYLRCIGQETPKRGILIVDPPNTEIQEYRWFGNGLQTFKQSHGIIELWIPLLFWFRDAKTSLPNFSLHSGELVVRVEFEGYANLVAIGDYGGGGEYNPPLLKECHLYTGHLTVTPPILNVYRANTKFQLVRLHKRHRPESWKVLRQPTGTVRLSGLHWVVETLYIGFRPRANLDNSRKWHKNTFIEEIKAQQIVYKGGLVGVNDAVFFDERNCARNLELLAHGVILYPKAPATFYNSYLPYHHGNFNTPENLGWYFMNFGIRPGEHQPSGGINASKSRELLLRYESEVDSNGDDIIGPSRPTDLIVFADVINFIVYDNGSAVRLMMT